MTKHEKIPNRCIVATRINSRDLKALELLAEKARVTRTTFVRKVLRQYLSHNYSHDKEAEIG